MNFNSSSPDQWKLELSSYSDRLISLKKPDLIPLDQFYRNELPSLIQNRNPNPYITGPELVELMKWKLARGKWRPRLLDFVSGIDEQVVKTASSKAFEAIPDVSKAVSELTVLKGIGPATASAVLAAYAPQVAPFMSDEAMVAVLGNAKDYTLKQYVKFAGRLQEKAKELSSSDLTFTPSDVERALWSAAIASKLNSFPKDQNSNSNPSKTSKRKRNLSCEPEDLLDRAIEPKSTRGWSLLGWKRVDPTSLPGVKTAVTTPIPIQEQTTPHFAFLFLRGARMTLLPFTDRKCRRSPRSTPLLYTNNSTARSDQFREFSHGDAGASFSGAVFNLSTTIVGAGIMALPATLKQLGLLPGLIVIVLAAMLTEKSIDMILRFSRASKSSSYAALVGDAFGGAGRNLLQIFIVINNLGMLVVYMIIIGDVLSGLWSEGIHHSGVMEEWFGQHWWTSRSSLMLLTTLFVIAPLISFRRVDSLKYTSALSVLLALVFVVITAGIAIMRMINGSIGMPKLMPEIVDQASFWKLFTTVPVLVTAYICHHNIHPIDNELTDSTKMKSIVKTSLALCSSLYVLTSFFGFLLFGDQTMDDVLGNFDGYLGTRYSALLNDIVRISYVIHLMLVFPIVFFSLRLNLDGLLFPYAIPIAYDAKRFFTTTVGLMSVIYLGANYVPSIWDAFQFTGATSAVSVGYIFPALIALRDTHGIANKNDRIVSWAMIILAVSSSCVAISSDVYSVFSKSKIVGS